MKTKTLILIMILLMAGLVIFSALIYARLPESVPTHWNERGEVNGYSSRDTAVFMLPLIMIGTSLLLIFLPRIDPRRRNILQFETTYNLFILVILSFMLFMHVVTLLAGLGVKIDILNLMLPAFAVLEVFMALLFKQARPNFMIGIRTAWTLSSDRVWEKTHQLAARLMWAAIPFTLLGMFMGADSIPFLQQAEDVKFFFLIVPLMAACLIPVVASYIYYRQEKQQIEA